MNVLEQFYSAHLHYTVAFRLWTDTCRQLAECKGSPGERQALVDESLRLSMHAADLIDETESLIGDTVEFIQQNEGADPELLNVLPMITNILKEDRARADDYTRFVMRRRSGGREKRPRKPQVANPFVYDPEEEEEIEAVVIPPEEPPEEEQVPEEQTESPVPEEEPAEEEESEEGSPEEPGEEQEGKE